MGSEKSPGAKYIDSLILKYPHAGNLTIAKMACKENPKLYTGVEQARHFARYSRGAIGQRDRQKCGANLPPKMPLSKRRIGGWEPYVIDDPCIALVLSDLHIPYYEESVLDIALKHGKKKGCDVVVLNGDIIDCHAISKWQTDPKERDFPSELQDTRDALGFIRSKFPKARIVFKLGNHEERYWSYMVTNAPALLHVDLFAFDTILELDERNIDMVDDKRVIRLGSLNVIHGHEYRFAISNPVNPARGLFLRAKAYAMCGHFHQESKHTANNIEGSSISTWSTGCMCDLHPPYMPINDWSHGFATVEVLANRKFKVKNYKIADGVIY